MSNDVIKLDYPLMEEMCRTFQKGIEQLENTLQEVQSIANTLEEGALLGQGGAAFTDALRSKLSPAIGRLTDKFKEMDQDVKAAMEQFRSQEDPSVAKTF